MMGATVGGLYAALNRAGMRKFWRSPTTQLNVVITGGGKGVGKAVAREFLRSANHHACHADYDLLHVSKHHVRCARTCFACCYLASVSCPTLQCAECMCFRSGDQVFITSRTAAGVQDVVTDMHAEVHSTVPYNSSAVLMVRSCMQLLRCPAKYEASLPDLSMTKVASICG